MEIYYTVYDLMVLAESVCVCASRTAKIGETLAAKLDTFAEQASSPKLGHIAENVGEQGSKKTTAVADDISDRATHADERMVDNKLKGAKPDVPRQQLALPPGEISASSELTALSLIDPSRAANVHAVIPQVQALATEVQAIENGLQRNSQRCQDFQAHGTA